MDDEPRVMVTGGENDERVQKIWALLNDNGIAPSIYESLADLRWQDELKFCGCGLPEEVRAWLLGIMTALAKRGGGTWTEHSEMVATIGADPDMIFYFVMYVLDAMGLTEHGGSVGGAWLTDKGRQLLVELQQEPAP